MNTISLKSTGAHAGCSNKQSYHLKECFDFQNRKSDLELRPTSSSTTTPHPVTLPFLIRSNLVRNLVQIFFRPLLKCHCSEDCADGKSWRQVTELEIKGEKEYIFKHMSFEKPHRTSMGLYLEPRPSACRMSLTEMCPWIWTLLFFPLTSAVQWNQMFLYFRSNHIHQALCRTGSFMLV